MLARANSGTVLGIDALPVTVETEANHGIPKWTLIGLARGAARESIDRVKTAIAAWIFSSPLFQVNCSTSTRTPGWSASKRSTSNLCLYKIYEVSVNRLFLRLLA